MNAKRKFLGRGGTRRGRGAGSKPEQVSLFDDDPDDQAENTMELGELARDVHRMTLETSSNVYAQRRAYW